MNAAGQRAIQRAAALWRRARHAGERGQSLIEYSLIIVLIGVAVIVIVGVVGHQITNDFSNVSNGLAQ